MIKRIAMPKTWPLGRKGKPRFIVKPRGSKQYSLALVVVLRDMLKLAKTRKEAKKILQQGEVFVNNKQVKDDKLPVHIFDIVSIPKINKYFTLILRNKKLALKDITEKESYKKILRIIGKKVLNNGKIQFNFFGGKNLILDIKAKVNDSLIWNLKDNNLIKHLPLKENARVMIISGKNAGVEGTVKKVEDDDITIKIQQRDIKIPIKNVWVID